MLIINYIRKYFALIMTLAGFYLGWYSSYILYKVKQLKTDLNAANEVIKNKDKIIAINNQNLQQRDKEALAIKNDRDNINNQLLEQLRINENDKKYIDEHNRITADLLRRVGALRAENTKLSTSVAITPRVVSADETISAYEYVQWAAGLKAHDDQCVVAFNGLQKIYNQQMTLINGFNK